MHHHLRDGTLEVVQNGYMHHHLRDGNFIGILTFPSSTSNKVSIYQYFFQQRLWIRSPTFLNMFIMLLSMTSSTQSITPPSSRHPLQRITEFMLYLQRNLTTATINYRLYSQKIKFALQPDLLKPAESRILNCRLSRAQDTVAGRCTTSHKAKYSHHELPK